MGTGYRYTASARCRVVAKQTTPRARWEGLGERERLYGVIVAGGIDPADG